MKTLVNTPNRPANAAQNSYGGGNSHPAAGHITHFGVTRISLLSLFYTLALLLTVGVADAWAGTKRIYFDYSAVTWWSDYTTLSDGAGYARVHCWGGNTGYGDYTMSPVEGQTYLAYCDIDDGWTSLCFYRCGSDYSWWTKTADYNTIGSNNRFKIKNSSEKDGNIDRYKWADSGAATRWAQYPSIDGLLYPCNPHLQTFNGENTFVATLAAHATYEFKIIDGTTLYGLNNHVWTSSVSEYELKSGESQIRLCTAGAGEYTFVYNPSTHKLSVTYPTVSHPDLDYCYVINYNWSPSTTIPVWKSGSTKVAEWNDGSTIAGTGFPGTPLYNTTTIGGTTYFYIAPGEYANFLVSKNGDDNDRSGDLTTSEGYGKRRYYNGSSWVWDTFNVRIQLDDRSATTAVVPTYMDVAFNSDVLTDLTSVPLKTNYTFGGFYTNSDGTGTQVINADGEWIASVVDYTDASKHWIHPGTSTTLYAQWTENKHNVTVAVSPAGAGSVQVSGSPINSVEDIGYATHSPVMTAVPTNAAWVFKEWQVSSYDVQLDLEKNYTTTGTTMEITATDDGQTLTAVFEPRFYLVGGEIVNAEDSEGTGTSSGMPGWVNYNVPFQVVTNTPILATCSLTLGTNTNFYIMVRDRENGLSYGRASSTLGDDFPLVFEDQDNKVLFHSNGGTGYIFKITAIDGSGHPTVSVERPHRVNFGHRRVDIDGNAHNDNIGGSLAVTAGGATLSSGDWVTYNTNVQYDAATSLIPGYIRTWYTSDSYASTFDADGVWSHNLTSDDNVYVRFTEIPTSVTLANDGHGTVQIGGVDKTNTTCGVTTTRSLTAVPDDGYRFSSWTTSTTPDFDVDDAGNAEVTLTGHGAGTAGTLTANFSERWQLKAETGEWGSSTFTISNIAMVSGDIVGYVDISLAANTDYQFTIVDLQESATYKNGSDQVYYMTNGNSHNWSFATGKTYNCGITTAGAGTYRFTWNITDKTLTVTYPNFVIYRSGDKAGDPRATEEDVESYAGGTIAKAIEFRMKVGALDRWYSLCLPFTVTAVKVWDDEDEAYYDLVPYYRTSVESTLNGGHYIIRTPSAATDLALADFDDWRDPTDPTGYLPSKNTPYIIQWHMTYFQDKYISFFGPAGQIIPASMTAGGAPSSDNVVNVCVNEAMTSGSKAGAYILEGDYGDGAWLRLEDASANRTIPPFECYILASSTTTAQYKVIHRRMTLNDTPTGWESVNTPSGGKAAKMLMDGQLYIIRGDNMYTIQGVLVK